ncbi:MAG: GNAT family N-acetyltransferase [Bacilli bacterium]|nr:GNAT family N-acetyltransferase [Bacilli bacterium]
MKIIPFHSDADMDVFNRILAIMKRLSKEGVFSGTFTRLASSIFAFLINENGKDVGFIYFVDENIDDVLFVDMGFIPEARGKGLAAKAMDEIIKSICSKYDAFLVSEVDPRNIAAVKSTEKSGAIRLTNRHYLLQPERFGDFLNHLYQLGIDLNEHTAGKRPMF